MKNTFDWFYSICSTPVKAIPVKAKFKWFAIDESGIGYVYTNKPDLDIDRSKWEITKGAYHDVGKFSNVGWHVSLINRAKNIPMNTFIEVLVESKTEKTYTLSQITEFNQSVDLFEINIPDTLFDIVKRLDAFIESKLSIQAELKSNLESMVRSLTANGYIVTKA